MPDVLRQALEQAKNEQAELAQEIIKLEERQKKSREREKKLRAVISALQPLVERETAEGSADTKSASSSNKTSKASHRKNKKRRSSVALASSKIPTDEGRKHIDPPSESGGNNGEDLNPLQVLEDAFPNWVSTAELSLATKKSSQSVGVSMRHYLESGKVKSHRGGDGILRWKYNSQ